MKENDMGTLLLLCLLSFSLTVHSQSNPDVLPMQALKASIANLTSLGWSNPDPCLWNYITCRNNRVTHIEIGHLNLKGTLPPDLMYLESLIVLQVQHNKFTGPIPSLSGLTNLQTVFLDNNGFSQLPSGFFKGLMSLQFITLDNNPFSSWEIPESLKDATQLQIFSANLASISGTIPDFLGDDTFPRLTHLLLGMNNLQGQIPASFAKSSIQTLWLNNQMSDFRLNGSVAVLQNMTSLIQVWLQGNRFTGPLPDLSRLSGLEDLNLSNNQLTGIFPSSLASLPKLSNLYFSFNLFQGPTPDFRNSEFDTDIEKGFNSFCLGEPGIACDSRVNVLLSIAETMGYPVVFARSWKGNDPCDIWKGILCNDNGDITVVNFQNLGLSGTISSNFSMLKSLEQLILSGNSLTGTIPNELTSLPNLVWLDVSNNHLYGKVPCFGSNVMVNTDGNPNIEKVSGYFPRPGKPTENPPVTPPKADGGGNSSSSRNKIVVSIIAVFSGVLIVGLVVIFYTGKRKRSEYWKHLRNATNNFSQKNILGRGGFGTVYKGELPDGMKIAVKRMKCGMVTEQGLTAEFKSEIEVLSRVRHCHLVSLLGYCLEGNERLLVYEYMPQGSLSNHLFNWKEEGLKPLEWSRRLTIALDVARGLEYLHGLAHQSFIHRDLKPSNILLGDDMRAKVADFGLARLVPEKGRYSIETRLVGTFGYIAPEYIVTGRVTTKVDVFSFGVILMELITGKKAVDATRPEDMVYLIPWFRRMRIDLQRFTMAIDQTIELDEETLESVSTVAELANHCCTSEAYQRPDMSHVVNVLSSLAELWRPVEPVYDDIYGINRRRVGP